MQFTQEIVNEILNQESEGNQFNINLNDAWSQTGYSRKDKLMPLLHDELIEGVDFQNSRHGVYLLTLTGFEILCAASRTEQGKALRRQLVEFKQRYIAEKQREFEKLYYVDIEETNKIHERYQERFTEFHNKAELYQTKYKNVCREYQKLEIQHRETLAKLETLENALGSSTEELVLENKKLKNRVAEIEQRAGLQTFGNPYNGVEVEYTALELAQHEYDQLQAKYEECDAHRVQLDELSDLWFGRYQELAKVHEEVAILYRNMREEYDGVLTAFRKHCHNPNFQTILDGLEQFFSDYRAYQSELQSAEAKLEKSQAQLAKAKAKLEAAESKGFASNKRSSKRRKK